MLAFLPVPQLVMTKGKKTPLKARKTLMLVKMRSKRSQRLTLVFLKRKASRQSRPHLVRRKILKKKYSIV